MHGRKLQRRLEMNDKIKWMTWDWLGQDVLRRLCGRSIAPSHWTMWRCWIRRCQRAANLSNIQQYSRAHSVWVAFQFTTFFTFWCFVLSPLCSLYAPGVYVIYEFLFIARGERCILRELLNIILPNHCRSSFTLSVVIKVAQVLSCWDLSESLVTRRRTYDLAIIYLTVQSPTSNVAQL